MQRLLTWIKWISILLIVVSLFMIMRTLPVGDAITRLETWIREFGVMGLVVFAIIYAVATVLMMPGSPLTLAAGAIFGPLWGGWGLLIGTLAASVGSNLGAAFALLIGRYVARNRVAKWAKQYPKFDAVDRAVAEGGWKVVAMLRLSPAVPFNMQNYLYGLTRIPFWTCVLTSIVAMLPGTFLYVYIGYIGRVSAEAAAGTESVNIWKYVLLGLGLLATIVVTIYITMLARKMLQRQAQAEGLDELTDEEGDDDTKGNSDEMAGEDQKATDEPKPMGVPWGTITAAALAVVMVTMASCAQFAPMRFQNALRSTVGLPPMVQMQEAYQEHADGPTVDHTLFGELLARHVDDAGWVDYEALAQDEKQLDRYLDIVAKAPFDQLGRNEKLALLINAYNAYTLKLILNHAPLQSIRDIPDPWGGPTWNVGGNMWTLNQIEHEQIRPKFSEPRIHFVLVCAAAGCPPLRQEAYTASRLDAQLEEQTRYVHNQAMWFDYDDQSNTAYLTELYKWYGSDFEQAADSIPAYLAQFSDQLKSALEAGTKPTIKWIPYDWTLNSQANRYPRDQRPGQ